jgi:hypothetical protein
MSGSERKLARSFGAASSQTSARGGISAPVTRKIVARPDGATSVQLSISITDLPSPSRSYSADQATISFNGADAVHFLFWQHTIRGKPRSMVGVKVYSDSAVRLHESCGPIRPVLEAFVERNKIQIPNVQLVDEPDQAVSLVATMAQISFAGFEAEVSFFHLSPYGVHLASQRNEAQIPVDPVVQIDLSTGMLASLMQELDRLAPFLPKEETLQKEMKTGGGP